MESSFRLREAIDQEDYNWVVKRHGQLYLEEYNWNSDFEDLVADIVAKFVAKHDSTRERCWIAEDLTTKDRLGCIFCVEKESGIAQLRLLLVDPKGRGRGVGSTLVKECVRFAKEAGYSQMMLWTNHPLTTARQIYEKVGFVEKSSEKHHSFGHDLNGQCLWKDL